MSEEKQYKEALAALLKDGKERSAFAELMVEYINPNHITEEIVGMIMPTRVLKPGDLLVKKIRKGIKVYTHVPGAIPLKSEVTVSDTVNYVLDMAVVALTANEWELERGELGSVADLRREALAALRDFYVKKLFTALSTVWSATNTPNNYTSTNLAGLEVALQNAIDRINRTTSGAKAIVGTRAALTQITKFGAFWSDGGLRWQGVDSQLEEVMRTGFLGQYYGVPLVVLNQVFDNPEDNRAMLPDDKILVIGENVGEFVIYGEPKYKEWTDMRPTPPQWNMDISQQFGFIVDNAEGIYVIKLA